MTDQSPESAAEAFRHSDGVTEGCPQCFLAGAAFAEGRAKAEIDALSKNYWIANKAGVRSDKELAKWKAQVDIEIGRWIAEKDKRNIAERLCEKLAGAARKQIAQQYWTTELVEALAEFEKAKGE